MLETQFLKELKHQCTRDLYWLLASPYPLNPLHSSFRLFPEDVLRDLLDQHLVFIQELDENPAEFITFLSTKPTRRLGIYAERLMAFFFRESPLVNLITHSFQLIRDGETKGEIDFIIEWKGELYHIELAVKYYLGYENLHDFNNWIGPSGNDTLGKKLERVFSRQLPLINEPEVQELIAGRPISSYLFLKGKFFCNKSIADRPTWLNPSAQRGLYYRVESALPEFLTANHQQLIRPNWMSDLIDLKSENLRPIDIENIELQILEYGGIHCVPSPKSNETCFIVLNTWPKAK